MNRLLTAVLLVTSLHVLADDLIEFQDGDVIRAEDFNHNFEELEADIANIPAGPAGATGPQGPAGADGIAAGLACTTNQIIKWNGIAWVCAEASGPQLTQVSVDCTENFATPETCSASCGDKVLVSGGCQFAYLNQAIYLKSTPENNRWSCGIGDGGAGSHVNTAYAICQ